MFEKVSEFESKVAEFYGAPYAVATDCCTHALELCLRVSGQQHIQFPTHTYVSIPMIAIKLGLEWEWKNDHWKDYYYLGNTNVIDAAVYWKRDGYIPGTMMALSFQFKKHLSTNKGGMILLDDKELATRLKKMSYDGRDMSVPWEQQSISEIGYHYYMTPETAMLGLERLPKCIETQPKNYDWQNYPYLPDLPVFKN